MTRLEQLRQENIEKSKELLKLRDKHLEGEAWTAEENELCDRLHKELTEGQQAAEREEKFEKVQRSMDTTSTLPAGIPLHGQAMQRTDPEQRQEDARVALTAWGRHQAGIELTAAERNVIERTGFDLNRREIELRASQTTATDPEVIPTGFVAEFEKARELVSPIRNICRILPTAGGNSIDYPMVDDTAVDSAKTAEASALSETAFAPTKITFGATKYGSMVKITQELLEDAGFNLETEIAQLLGERNGRATNAAFTTGDGTGDPQGINNASVGAALGVTYDIGDAGAENTLSWKTVIDLIHSVDPAYRSNGHLMMHDTMLAHLRKLSDDNNNPIWNADLTAGAPGTIFGVPVVINQDMDSFSDSTATGIANDAGRYMLYGDFQKFIIRDVGGGPRLKVLRERYAESDDIAFILWSRHDSRYLNAGTDPIKCMNWQA